MSSLRKRDSLTCIVRYDAGTSLEGDSRRGE